MKDIIQQIMNQENLDEIYGYAQNALFKDGPVSITTLEILSYLKLFAPDYFSAVEEEINHGHLLQEAHGQDTPEQTI